MSTTGSLRAGLNLALASITSLSLLAVSLRLAGAEQPKAHKPVLGPDLGPNVLLFDSSMSSADIQTEIVEVPAPEGPYGAKGVGEAPVIACPAAVANAVAAATGVRMRRLPMTPERVWRALNGG